MFYFIIYNYDLNLKSCISFYKICSSLNHAFYCDQNTCKVTFDKLIICVQIFPTLCMYRVSNFDTCKIHVVRGVIAHDIKVEMEVDLKVDVEVDLDL